MPYLARHFTVIAPDLVGHGESDKPRGDYSLGAHASSVRDLMLVLGHERASVVGHSLGGGIAMQFAYQFPERCERLVLVDSGGLGRDVNVLLRAATLPGAEFVLPLLAATRLLDAGRLAGRPARRARPARAHGHRGDRARARDAVRRRGARGLRAHAALGRRARRPASRRVQPAVPVRAHPVPADLGRARLDHPGRARPRGSRAARAAAAWRCSRTPGTSRSWTSRSASSTCSCDFFESTEPATLDADDWRALLDPH